MELHHSVINISLPFHTFLLTLSPYPFIPFSLPFHTFLLTLSYLSPYPFIPFSLSLISQDQRKGDSAAQHQGHFLGKPVCGSGGDGLDRRWFRACWTATGSEEGGRRC